MSDELDDLLALLDEALVLFELVELFELFEELFDVDLLAVLPAPELDLPVLFEELAVFEELPLFEAVELFEELEPDDFEAVL